MTIQPEDGDQRHGTPNGYNYHRCRCDQCRGAASQAQRILRATNERALESHRQRNRRYFAANSERINRQKREAHAAIPYYHRDERRRGRRTRLKKEQENAA